MGNNLHLLSPMAACLRATIDPTTRLPGQSFLSSSHSRQMSDTAFFHSSLEKV